MILYRVQRVEYDHARRKPGPPIGSPRGLPRRPSGTTRENHAQNRIRRSGLVSMFRAAYLFSAQKSSLVTGAFRSTGPLLEVIWPPRLEIDVVLLGPGGRS